MTLCGPAVRVSEVSPPTKAWWENRAHLKGGRIGVPDKDGEFSCTGCQTSEKACSGKTGYPPSVTRRLSAE